MKNSALNKNRRVASGFVDSETKRLTLDVLDKLQAVLEVA